MNMDLIDAQEKAMEELPVKRATFVAWSIEDCLEGTASVWATTRGMKAKKSPHTRVPTEEDSSQKEETVKNDGEDCGNKVDKDGLNSLQIAEDYWGATNAPPNIHIAMDPAFRQKWVADYLTDPSLGKIWANKDSNPDSWSPGQQFYKDHDGLLFCSNADYQPRLCVPEKQKSLVILEAHDSPLETAHAGPEKLWQTLSTQFYWK
jgi:hypothetical protein